MATMQSLLVKLGLDPDDFRTGLARASKSLTKFRSDLVENRRGIEDFGMALTSVGRTAAFASLISGAVSLSAALAPVAGSLLILPGAAMAGAAAFGALKVGMSGFGDAMSNMDDPAKFAEALKELSPAAAETATAIRDLVPAWKAMTGVVQESLFAGMAGEIKAVAGTYIPVLHAGLSAMTAEFNSATKGVAAFLQQASTVSTVETIFSASARAVGNLLDTLAPLTSVFLDIAAVGGAMFADLTEGAGAATQRFAEFISNARATGQLNEWIQSGLDVLSQLWTLLINLGAGIKGVFAAASGSGQSLLETLIQLTARFAEWANSAAGQEQLAATFNVLGQVLEHLLVILPGIAGAFGVVLGWIDSLSPSTQSLITGFLAWSVVIGLLISRFAPLISLLTTVSGKFLLAATTQGTMTNRIIAAIGRGMTAMLSWVARMGWMALSTIARLTFMAVTGVAKLTLMAVQLVAKAALIAAQVAAKFALMAARVAVRMTVLSAQVIARFVVMAAAATARAAVMAATVAAQFVVMAARATASMAAMAARVVARWAVMAAGAMARAVIMAAAWVVAMGPVGWVIAAVVGLVALIIANWDKVKSWTISAWNAVVSFVVGAWNKLTSAVSSGVDRVLSFVRSIPDKILSALSGLGNLLVNVGKDLIRGLIRGIEAAVGWLKEKLSWVTGMLPDWKGPMRVDARILAPTGRVIMSGLVDGIDVGAADVEKRLGQVTAALGATPTPRAGSSGQDAQTAALAAAVARAVRDGFGNAELVLDDTGGRVMARVVNRVNTRDARR